jgi:hypothetical protein
MLIQGSSVECLFPGYSFPLNINTSRCRVHVPNNLTCLSQLLLPSLNNNNTHGPCFAPRLCWAHVVCLATRRLLSSPSRREGSSLVPSHLLFLSSPSPILSSNPVSPFLFSSATPVKIRVPEGSVSSVSEQVSLLPLLPSSGTSLSLLFPSLVLLSPLFPQESLGYRSLLSFLRRPCFPFDYPEPGTSSSRHTRPSSPPRLTSGRASCSVFLLF